jgi:hypothetical protein
VACDSWIHPNPTWPDIVDSTTGRDGTRWDRALGLAIQQYIDQMAGPFYGLPTPANIAEEIAAARGNQDCLDDRLDNGLTEEGFVKLPPEAATVEQLGSISGRNLLLNDTLIVNPGGESEAPYPWQTDGTITWSITYDASETLGKVSVTNVGGATAQVYYEVIPASEITQAFLALDRAPGLGFASYITCGPVANVRPFIDDGDSILYGEYHPGGGTREWIKSEGVKPITALSQYFRVGFEVIAGATFDFELPMANIGPVPPEHWRGTPYREVIVPFNTVGTNLNEYIGVQQPTFFFMAPGCGVLELIACGAAEAVVGPDEILWTLQRWNGAAWEVVDTIGLNDTEQLQSKAPAVPEHKLLTAIPPRIDLSVEGCLFAYQLELPAGSTPWAEAAFVTTRWRVSDSPAALLYQEP